MSIGYEDRVPTSNSDGTPLFYYEVDQNVEAAMAARLERAWRCSILPFGKLCQIDFYASRHGRLVGVIELKNRTHSISEFSTVFLNVRKWLALTMASIGLNVPALFVVSFSCGAVKWINVSDIVIGSIPVRGCYRHIKSHSDIEPVIEVPIAALHDLP